MRVIRAYAFHYWLIGLARNPEDILTGKTGLTVAHVRTVPYRARYFTIGQWVVFYVLASGRLREYQEQCDC